MKGLSAAIALAVAVQASVIAITPVEAVMGPVQKIFYVHVPLAWWSFVSFGLCAVAGFLHLRRHDARHDRLAHAAAEVGLLLNTLALATGSLWAKLSWGAWWTWDPRLTTALVLWFLYAGVLVLRGLDMPAARRGTICSVVGIVAFLDVPLVFLSARLWRSIHPAVLASRDGGLEPEMLCGLMAAIAATGLVWLLLVRLRAETLSLSAALDDHMDGLLSGTGRSDAIPSSIDPGTLPKDRP